MYGINSYIAVPIIRRSGECFGTLCALDPEAKELDERLLDNFRLFAELIAYELESEEREQAREEELREAARVGELRDKLMGILGHDLRNPLNTISTAAQVLLKKSQTQTLEHHAGEKIYQSARRMQRMINDLLDLARTRLSEGIPIFCNSCDLREISVKVLEEFAVSHPLCVINFKAEGDFQGEWDADRLSQLVSNLVGNAIDYGEPEKPIEVFLKEEGETVAFSVHNYCEPIPAEKLENLFSPYRRAIVPGERRITKGLGLGLYIVQQIVRAHNGTINVTSDAENGKTLTIKLPRYLTA